MQFYITTRAELDYLDEKHTVCKSFLLFLICSACIFVFFLILDDMEQFLILRHDLLQVFGEVGEGLEALMRINEAFVDDNFRPYKNIRYRSYPILFEGIMQQFNDVAY